MIRSDDSGAAPRVRRFDVGELASPRRDDSGFLRVEGRISRIGVQIYEETTGEHRELRLPEEVFDPASVESFAQVPLTNTHPPQLLTPDTARALTIGNVALPRRDGDFLAAQILVNDREGIEVLAAGRSQLSCGYTCELDPTQDRAIVEKWGAYDFIQRKIRGNHVALVDSARAGSEARIRLDSGAARMVPSIPQHKHTENTMPSKLRIDGVDHEISESNMTAIEQSLARHTEKLRSEIASEKQRADSIEKKLGIVKGNATKLCATIARAKAKLDDQKARMMGCDECGGTGRVNGDDDAEKACDYCDGKGSVRLHEAVKSMMPEGEHPEPDDDDDDVIDDDDLLDVNELEVEQETETEAGKIAAKKDAASKRAAAIKLARQKRADSRSRILARAVKDRVALEVEARKHLGADAKLDGKPSEQVKREVLAKLRPSLKLDGKPATFIATAFEVATCESSTPAMRAIDSARGPAIPAPAAKGDAGPLSLAKSREDFATSRREAWKAK